MSNKIILQENNALLDEYIARINETKNTVALLPESGGGASIATRDITIKTKKMPTGSSFAERVDYVSVDENGTLTNSTISGLLYIETLTYVAIGTLLFIKTVNSPSSCTIKDTGLELVNFNSAVGAVIKVIGESNSTGFEITFA